MGVMITDALDVPTMARTSVYSSERGSFVVPSAAVLPATLHPFLDQRNKRDGLEFLSGLPPVCSPLAFFDPQYRGVMDRQRFGNEGTGRQRGRAALAQMPEDAIKAFIAAIERVLTPRGHLMLWVDKFHVAEGIKPWLGKLPLQVVDMITWNKGRMGMGYRSRRKCEYLMVIQKMPIRAKGVWTKHNIPDVWDEKVKRVRGGHPHAKPMGLQSTLIEATTAPGAVIVDPAAGTFSVMDAAHNVGRHFLGCDLEG
jgi:site-specific DNA-methyltransferase (adenine-specific)